MISRLATTIVASAVAISSLSAADFFPLRTGNSWTYRTQTGRTFTVRVGVPLITNDKLYYSLQGYVDSNLIVRVNEENTLVYLDNETNHERPLISFTPFEGGWWYAPYRACEQESQTQEKRPEYNGPAGEFRNVLEVRFRSFSCADAGTESEQFGENIGMLRRVEQSFAGPLVYDLVHARVGNMILNALPTGSFSVTLDQMNGSNTMTAVMRLRAPGQPLKLTFPTSQEFELVLRDDEGRTVWTWSEGQFFDQAQHDRTISEEWTIAVPMERAGTPAGAADAKNYTLHAWLTTDGPAPRYAATVPVTISSSVAE